MKKRILKIALGCTFIVGGLFLIPQNSEAAGTLSYSISAVVGADGCSYIFCTNSEGDSCSTPGSLVKVCNEQ